MSDSPLLIKVIGEMRHYGAGVQLALEGADLEYPRESMPLSVRKIKVLRLVLSGKDMTQIAEEMPRRFRTVSNRKQLALRKLGCAKDAELFQPKGNTFTS